MKAPLEPLPKLYATFEEFVADTMTTAEAHAAVKPGQYVYGLRKLNPATGEMVSRAQIKSFNAGSDEKTSEILARKRNAPRPKGERVERNGVKHPSETSMGFKVWSMFDDLWSIRNEPFTRETMIAEATNRHFNVNNVATELGLWKRFHGRVWRF